MPGHLTKEERDRLAQLHHQGYMQLEIARALNRSPGTISRELKRNRTCEVYHAAQAQEHAQRRRRERPLQRKMDRPELNEMVRARLIRYWSPDQIAGRLKLEFADDPQKHVCPQTIYAWIAERSKDRKYWQSYLRRRGKRPWSRREIKGSAASRAAIADRPAIIEKRKRLGDFEGDTVLGPPGTGGVVTLVDRQSRFTIVSKVPCKQAQRVHRKIRDRLKALDKSQRESVTFDNGTEFARCHLLEKHLNVKIYFAKPGCPYQRGTNENTNGLIRQFFPKGTDFRDITHFDVREVENLLNNRPRACLGYKTPNEVFHADSAAPRCN
jgi:transposase, IS30 family